MKKTLLSLIAVVALAFSSSAQTNAPGTNAVPPTLGEHASRILDFLAATGTNWFVAPYGIYCEDTKSAGAGIGAGYAVSDFVSTVLRLDYIDGDIWMPSGSVQFQLPMTLAGKVRVTPFVFTGIATPLSGRGDENGDVTGIAGTGLAARVTKHLGLVYDIEVWSRFEGIQHRFGLYWKF